MDEGKVLNQIPLELKLSDFFYFKTLEWVDHKPNKSEEFILIANQVHENNDFIQESSKRKIGDNS